MKNTWTERKPTLHSQHKNHRKAIFTLTPLAILAWVFGFSFSACTLVDFSMYTNTNLIPNGQFTANAATPALGWSADEAPPGSYASAVNMWWQDTTTDFGGYTSLSTLQSGLPALSDNVTIPPIYRLETKNLMPNGDFESAAPIVYLSPLPPGAVAATGIRNTPGLPVTATNTNSYIWNSSDIHEVLVYDLQALLPGFVANSNYNLSFVYQMTTDTSAKAFGMDDSSATNGIFTKIDWASTAIAYRFPFNVPVGNSLASSLLFTSSTRTLLYFNTTNINASNGLKTFTGSIDDIQIIRSDLNNAIRLQIPWTDPARPDLELGGHYTFKLWVRRDMTSTYAGGGSRMTNRFDADFVTVLLTNSKSGAVVCSRNMPASVASTNNWTNYADWDSWTELSFSFVGPSYAQSALTLAISTTNMASSSYRSPGSVLVANPRLFWSPN